MPRDKNGERILRATTNRKAYEVLTEEAIDARVGMCHALLRQLGAYQDTTVIPMAYLTDEELDERIRLVEAHLRHVLDGGEEPGETAAKQAALRRQFDQLDWLINHPDATISAVGWLAGVDDERSGWAKDLLDE